MNVQEQYSTQIRSKTSKQRLECHLLTIFIRHLPASQTTSLNVSPISRLPKESDGIASGIGTHECFTVLISHYSIIGNRHLEISLLFTFFFLFKGKMRNLGETDSVYNCFYYCCFCYYYYYSVTLINNNNKLFETSVLQLLIWIPNQHITVCKKIYDPPRVYETITQQRQKIT